MKKKSPLSQLGLLLAGLALGAAPGLAAQSFPYVTEPALGGLSFDEPVAVVSPPGTGNRVFVVEKAGRIVVVADSAAPTRTVFLDITARVGNSGGELGLLALAFHPDYARNRQFYVWYTSEIQNVREDRLARFTASEANPNAADAASEQLMISQMDEAPNHNGGQLLFGSDGYLYLSIGDEGAANDRYQNSQRIDKDYFSGIFRLDVDKRAGSLPPNPHASLHAGTYAIPPDNPFVGARSFNGRPVEPANVRTELWAVGLRNPWRMSFDPDSGTLWEGDVGQNLHEEINIITRGGNYGWNYREGHYAGPRANPPPEAHFVEPIWDYPRTQGSSITGGILYRGARYPDLAGKYIFADYASGHIWALTPDGTKSVLAASVKQIAQVTGITSFAIEPGTGDILLTCLSPGHVLRLVPRK